MSPISFLVICSFIIYYYGVYDYVIIQFIVTEIMLSEYERVVGVAAGEGINTSTGERAIKWTYIQAVFFAATILTTIGKYKKQCYHFIMDWRIYFQMSQHIIWNSNSNSLLLMYISWLWNCSVAFKYIRKDITRILVYWPIPFLLDPIIKNGFRNNKWPRRTIMK